jgi:hypothetical protein
MAARKHLWAMPLLVAVVLACLPAGAPAAEPRKTQTITFTSTAPSNAKVEGPTYTVAATASSGLPVELTSANPEHCSLSGSGSGSTVSFIGAGPCTIDANQPGSAEYEKAKQVTQSFEVAKGTQTIKFTSTPPSGATVGGPPYTVTAQGGFSGEPVELTVDAASKAVCSISGPAPGSSVSFTGGGTCTIDANQNGNANYEAAPQVQQSFTIKKKTQLIKFESTPPEPAQVGKTYNAVVAATSGLPVALTSATPSVCTVSGTNVTLLGAGECTIDANQAGNAEYEPASQAQQSFQVAKKSQTVTFTSTPPNPATIGGPTYTVTATASSGLAVSLTIDAASKSVCSLSGSTVTFIGTGTCTIDANQAGNAEYAPAPTQQQTFTVSGKKTQTISFTRQPPEPGLVGGSYTAEATASSGLPVSFSSATPSVCTVSGATVTFVAGGTCTIDADQAGNAEYEPALTVQQQATVVTNSQSISFTSTPPSPALFGGFYTVAATASSGLPVSFSSATPSVCIVLGSRVAFVDGGTCTINANQGGNGQWAPAPQAQQSFAVIIIASPGPTQPGPTVAIKPVVAPNSNFKVVAASLSLATYAITFVEAVNDPGTFKWVLTFENGKFGVYAGSVKAKKCKRGWLKLKGRCHPARVLFGKGRETVATAGSVTFTVRPTRSGVAALRVAFKRNKGLPVTADVTYQSVRGGSPVARVQSLIVKGRR